MLTLRATINAIYLQHPLLEFRMFLRCTRAIPQETDDT
ncbi:Uncharacterised protein [Yersinia wautersii]|uniref:Uncharacterized protein n=1 Tax=Yersinia wautersii TaxID=1341643 RepID=A0ABM9TLK0_9GAMM|nr:Uncharacterised protein [Yersinia wautersii]